MKKIIGFTAILVVVFLIGIIIGKDVFGQTKDRNIILPPEEIQVQEAAERGNDNVIEAHEFIPYEEQ